MQKNETLYRPDFACTYPSYFYSDQGPMDVRSVFFVFIIRTIGICRY